MRWTRKLQLVIPTLLIVTACGAPEAPQAQNNAPASVPDKPSKPVELNVLDVAGNLQLTQGMIDEFVKTHPDYRHEGQRHQGDRAGHAGQAARPSRTPAPRRPTWC